jgi:hypothetical protein
MNAAPLALNIHSLHGHPACATAIDAIIAQSALYRAIFYHSRQVQSGDVDLAAIIQKHNHTRSRRMDRSVISRWNGVFVTVTCADGERFKGRSVQQFSNARNPLPL